MTRRVIYLIASLLGAASLVHAQDTASSKRSRAVIVADTVVLRTSAHTADSLAALDPADALTRALATKDRRLLGVQGDVFVVPGIHIRDYQRYRDRLGVREIVVDLNGAPATDHARVYGAAYRFAREYNRLLLCRLRLRSE